MSFENNVDYILKQARSIAEKSSSWVDFSNELFAPEGVIAKVLPDEMERQLFFDSVQYREVREIRTNLMRKLGIVAGAESPKSGKFMVRIPKSVHQSLEIEAKREGVSLNQLAACKLSMPLREADGLRDEFVIEAFNAVHDGYSTDWMIVDPQFNERFLEKCHRLGLSQSDWMLNHTLMNIRKNSKNRGKLNPTTKRSGFRDYDDYSFASEISVRTLQRTDGVTLDRILCDPVLRSKFDELANQLSLDQPLVKLRCAALNLRKTHRLQPIDCSVDAYDLVAIGPVKEVDLASIAALPGTYVFYDHTRPIFAGETSNLQKRIQLHRQVGLPNWLDADKEDSFVLKTLVIPSAKQEERLDWLGAFINRERPLLNYQKAA